MWRRLGGYRAGNKLSMEAVCHALCDHVVHLLGVLGRVIVVGFDDRRLPIVVSVWSWRSCHHCGCLVHTFFAWAPLELRGALVAVLCFQCALRRTRCIFGCTCFGQIRVQWRMVCRLRPPLEILALVDVVSPLEVDVVPGGSLF